MGLNLAQFVIGAGTGYLKGENDNRNRARQDARDAQDKELFDSRMRRDRMQEEDMVATRADRQTLRTAAKPVVPVDDMVKPNDMDNRDVGLAENASRPDGGLSLAGARVGGKSYATRAEADTAAAQQNTPEATTKRYAEAQRSTGDLAGATATEQNFSATLRERQTRAADAMMNEIGKGFMTGGWQGGTEVLSRSGADGNDYRSEIDPVSGKVRMHQTQRSTGQTRVLGEFTNDNSGMLDAYKQIGSAIAGKPDVAMAHIADREKRSDKLAIEARKSIYDEGRLDAMGKRIEMQGELGAARIEAAQLRSNNNNNKNDGTSREERLRYTSLFNESGRRMAEAQKALTALQKDVMYSMAKPGTPQHEEMQGIRKTITDLGEERKMYQSMLAGSQTTAPGLSSAQPNAPAGQAARDSDRMSILQSELDKAKQSGNTGDVAALEREIGRGGGKPAPTPKPAAPKPGTVQGGYRFKGGNPADKANWERE